MAAYSRRQLYGALLIVLGVVLFASAFFVRVRRLAVLGTLLVATGALLLARKLS